MGERLFERVRRVVGWRDVRGRREVEIFAGVVGGAPGLEVARGEERHRRLIREGREDQADVTVAVEIGFDAEERPLARDDDVVEIGLLRFDHAT